MLATVFLICRQHAIEKKLLPMLATSDFISPITNKNYKN